MEQCSISKKKKKKDHGFTGTNGVDCCSPRHKTIAVIGIVLLFFPYDWRQFLRKGKQMESSLVLSAVPLFSCVVGHSFFFFFAFISRARCLLSITYSMTFFCRHFSLSVCLFLSCSIFFYAQFIFFSVLTFHLSLSHTHTQTLLLSFFLLSISLECTIGAST